MRKAREVARFGLSRFPIDATGERAGGLPDEAERRSKAGLCIQLPLNISIPDVED